MIMWLLTVEKSAKAEAMRMEVLDGMLLELKVFVPDEGALKSMVEEFDWRKTASCN